MTYQCPDCRRNTLLRLDDTGGVWSLRPDIASQHPVCPCMDDPAWLHQTLDRAVEWVAFVEGMDTT